MKCLFCLFLGLIVPTAAEACSSPFLNSNEDYFREADRVFVGFVESTEYVKPAPNAPVESLPETGSQHAPFGYIKVGYDLGTVLKGPEEAVPIVTWNLYLGGCGVPVLAGAEMLFLVKDFTSYMSEEELKQVPENAVGMLLPYSYMIPPTDAAHDALIAAWKDISNRVAQERENGRP
ncbi:hypothetical protein [Roseibium sediminicola]|uniref:Lipoprotein n=1 Tax=Roseibium sediminicola TaxID=2933272 RepID=A0ABT0GQG6_9HYPH|nr:hypothetical protein [Roseibium sp. CAU 1639]MCK7611663.1 hypothetical protein [Roseibium sp. CAU 1639]